MKKSPEFKLGAIWVLKRMWDLLPFRGDEPNADMVYYLKKIAKEIGEEL
jgi:hypothetical protein